MAEPALDNDLRRARERAGLTQKQLAARAGVTRQTVSSVEAGRYVPSTALALRLARAVGARVDDLFWVDDGDAAVSAHLVGRAAPGARHVALGRVGARWVAHRLSGEAACGGNGLVDAAPARTGGLARVRPLASAERLAETLLVAGCAPALAVAARRLAGDRAGGASLQWIDATSRRALAMLRGGEVHVAGAHLLDPATGEFNRPIVASSFSGRRMVAVTLARWQQGLVVAAGNPRRLGSAAALLRPDIRLVRRDPGAASELLLSRLIGGAGDEAAVAGARRRAPGPVGGHMDVARFVAAGAADAGVAVRAAAAAYGLGFVPLAEERFDLVFAEELAGDPRVARLLDLLDSRPFRRELDSLGGYDTAETGHIAVIEAAP